MTLLERLRKHRRERTMLPQAEFESRYRGHRDRIRDFSSSQIQELIDEQLTSWVENLKAQRDKGYRYNPSFLVDTPTLLRALKDELADRLDRSVLHEQVGYDS
jgi:hypothetical protein